MNEKRLLFVVCRCHKEGKIGMISSENTHKMIFINVFLIYVSQANIEKCHTLISFSGLCTLWQLP